MKRSDLLERLDYLENLDPRRDPRHLGCAVWIWERDQVEEALSSFDQAHASDHAPKRPALGSLARQALDQVAASAKDVPLWIAVELTEAGYIVEIWPEFFAVRNLWRCEVSDKTGRRYPVSVRVHNRRLKFAGVALANS